MSNGTPAQGGTRTTRLGEVLQGQSHRPPPVWLMRQAGRYLPEYRATREKAGDFLSLCYTPELAAEVTLQPIRRYGFDASIVFADILVVPHALGRKLWFVTGEGPKLEPLRRADEIPVFDGEAFSRHCAPVMETLRILRRELPEPTALIGFAGAPWTVATYMVEGGSSRDFAASKRCAVTDPEGFGRLIDRLVEATVAYLSAQAEAGAEVVQLFDSWAGALPEMQFRRWVIEPNRQIVTALKQRFPDLGVIGFPRGAGALYQDFVEQTGVDAVSLDSGVPLSWARDVLQPHVALQGNLDPQVLVAGGPAMRDEVSRILTTLGAGPFVFNLGHGIVPDTPPEHVAELVATVRGG